MQQVNFFQDEFRKQEQPLSVRQVGLAAIALLAALVILSGLRYWQLGASESELQQAKSKQQVIEKQLAEYKKNYSVPQADARLAARLARMQRDTTTKQQVLSVLSGKQFGNTDGFVEQVSGLARQRIEGMWLTGLQIQRGGVHIGMQGNALKPELLPQYLQRLANEPAFEGTEFNTFLMQRRDEAPHWIEFNLRSLDGAEPS